MDTAKGENLKVGSDRSIKLEFHGAKVTSDGGLLDYRDLDDALGLFDSVPTVFSDSRTGRNVQHDVSTFLRQSIYSRLAGYEDVNDAERLAVDPVMLAITGKKNNNKNAASTNTLGRFETEMLTVDENLDRLSDVNGRWIQKAQNKTSHRRIILDMDNSKSPVYGAQAGSAYNGHFGCTCFHPLFCFNQFGDCEGVLLRPGNVHSAEQWIKESEYAQNWTRLSCKYFISNQVRLWLFVLACNLGSFLRRLVLPGKIKHWSLRSLLTKLIKIGAKVVRHSRYVTFQMVPMYRDDQQEATY